VTTKFTAKVMLLATSRGAMPKLAIGTPRQSDFLLLRANLTEALTDSTFSVMFSFGPSTEGNLPALLRPGPTKRGILRIKDAEATKAPYALASCLTAFLFLFNFLRSSSDRNGTFWSLASPTCLASPMTQTENFGRGMFGNRMAPLKRLSLLGS